ncbi:MAG: aspartate kinase [Bacteriovoracaceae bacterium]|nr:aspartate kinase [Bacteriovoracaceae bacterium]
MSNLTISKFGGSSVKNAEAMRRCSQILSKRPESRVVIISATYNTTNELEEMAGLSLKQIGDAKNHLDKLFDRHLDLAKSLNCSNDSLSMINELKLEASELIVKMNSEGHYSPEVMDQVYSLGERLSSTIFSSFLSNELKSKVIYFDIRKVLHTDSSFTRAIPNIEKIKLSTLEHLVPLIEDNNIIVTQGFVGCSLDGKTTTLGREGSDYSATLLGEALNATQVNIWTDVPGIATADPKKMISAKFVKEMNFEEASVLAKNGAKVLFPDTLEPIKRSNSTVFVGSSLNPELGGTLINSKVEPSRMVGMASEFNRVTISGTDMSTHKEKILEFIESYNPNILASNHNELTLEFSDQQVEVAFRLLHGFLFEE